MHVRLLLELMLWRWPALLRHRRQWRIAGFVAALALCGFVRGGEAPPDPLLDPAHRIEATAWRELAEGFAKNPDVIADFTERRRFPFKREPVTLTGEVRVSPARGLSLHYLTPDERTVILDRDGVLIRSAAGSQVPPDPRAAAANQALLHLLSFDLAALEPDFELYGRREGASWTLAMVARTETLRRSVGKIFAAGEGATVRQIEIRRTERQAIEISIAAPRATAPFTPEELKAFFR